MTGEHADMHPTFLKAGRLVLPILLLLVFALLFSAGCSSDSGSSDPPELYILEPAAELIPKTQPGFEEGSQAEGDLSFLKPEEASRITLTSPPRHAWE
jgi:hypothetical protein